MTRILCFFALWATLAAIACGGSSKVDETAVVSPTFEPQPDELLARAASAAQALRSFHFRLDHENGSSPLPLNLKLLSAEGEIVVPGRLGTELRAVAGSINIRVNVISIDDKTWMTNPFSRQWQELPGATVRDFADPSALIEALLNEINDVRLEGLEEVNGTETYRLLGSMDSGALGLAFPFAEAGMRVEVGIWVGVEDHLPRRARISGRLAGGEAENIVRLLELSEFNTEIEINPPE